MLENFINQKDGLTYDEIGMIEDCVVLPLIKAIAVCEHNFKMKVLAKKIVKILIIDKRLGLC